MHTLSSLIRFSKSRAIKYYGIMQYTQCVRRHACTPACTSLRDHLAACVAVQLALGVLAPLLCARDSSLAANLDAFWLYCAAFSAQEALLELPIGGTMQAVPMHVPEQEMSVLYEAQRVWLQSVVEGLVRG